MARRLEWLEVNKHCLNFCAPTHMAWYFMELHTWRLTKWRGGLENKKPTSMAWCFVLHKMAWYFVEFHTWKLRKCRGGLEIRKANRHGVKFCAPTNMTWYFMEFHTWKLRKWWGGLEDKKPTSFFWPETLCSDKMAWYFVELNTWWLRKWRGGLEYKESQQTWPQTLCSHKQGMILWGLKYLKV